MKSPIRFNLILVGFILFFLHYLKTHQLLAVADEQVIPIGQKVVKLLLNVVFYTLAIISIFALWVNAVIWLINFILLKNSTAHRVEIENNASNIQIFIREAFAPLLGTLHAYIKTDNRELIYPILFLKNKVGLFYLKGTQSTQPVALPHYCSYHLQAITLQYIDFLRMTALPVSIPTQYQFNNHPPTVLLRSTVLTPIVHLQNDEEVVMPRKKDGDYLHYKNFESGDDIRRVVWKVYAKNKELVVRVPETEYEFANTCYMSYCMYMQKGLTDKYAAIALDYFKWSIWNIYQSFRQQNNLFLKQESGTTTLPPINEVVQDYIINLEWCSDVTRKTIDVKTDNIICVHSGMEVAFVRDIISKAKKEQLIYFIPLSQAFRVNIFMKGLKKIFFTTTHPDPITQAKINFRFVTTYKKWKKKEQEIAILLQNSLAKTTTITSKK